MSLDDKDDARGQILFGLPTTSYHADQLGDDGPPSLSASMAKRICEETPEAARLRHPRLRRPDDEPLDDEGTDASLRGNVLHRLVLGRGADILVISAEDKDGQLVTNYKTKAAQEQKREILSMGCLPLLAREREPYARAAVRIKTRLLEDWGIELNGESEVAVVWHEKANDGTPVRCRALFDHLWPSADALDLKTCGWSVKPDACDNHIASDDHDIQCAAYRSALAHLYPDARSVRFRFAFAEAAAPNSVTVVEPDGVLLDLGERRWRYAIETFARCMKTGVWPASYVPKGEVVRATARAWKLSAWEMKMQSEQNQEE